MTRHSAYPAPEPLGPNHDTSAFDCGSEAQTRWLRRYALQAQQAGTSRVFVVSPRGERGVVGYYALAAGSVEHEEASTRIKKGVGRYAIPVVILTRLGVDTREQGHGLGRALVRDALGRVLVAAESIGVRALLIHAESDDARLFHLRLAEFDPSPTDPLHLYLLFKDLKATMVESSGGAR